MKPLSGLRLLGLAEFTGGATVSPPADKAAIEVRAHDAPEDQP